MDMNDKDHELMWKYIDGDCEETEISYVQEKLEVDPIFKEEWKQKLILHEALKEIDFQQPSMRFVKNVMEALPKPNFRLVIQPLIPKSMVLKFIFGAAAFIAAMILISWGNDPLSSPFEQEPPFYTQISNTLNDIPLTTWQIITAVTFGFLTLLGLDYWLSKNLNRKR